MPEKPKRTLESLLADQEAHPNRGKVSGEYVCSVSTTEQQFALPQEIYDKINQTRAAVGMTKAQFSLQALLTGLNFLSNINNVGLIINFKSSREFNYRTSLPDGLYNFWLAKVEAVGLTKNQAAAFCFNLLIDELEPEYRAFVKAKSTETGYSESQIEAMLISPEETNLFDLSQTELNILLPGNIYNQIIQCRGALGLQKSQIAQASLFNAVKILSQFGTGVEIQYQTEGKSNFRGNVPTVLYRKLFAIAQEMGITSKHAIGAIAFQLFCDSHTIADYYRQFIQRRSQELNVEEIEIVSAIYGYSKMLSRNRAIELLRENDPTAYESKMNI